MGKYDKISLVVLTYNAKYYIKRTLETLKETNYGNYEIIVFDNASGQTTKKYLKKAYKSGLIDKLVLSDDNLMFIKGNNEAFKHCDPNSKYILFLNSDIEIKSKDWLLKMVEIHKKGLTATSICDEITNRPDGWCFLIDYELFKRYPLDHNQFQVYYSVSYLNAKLIKAGYSVQTIKYYNNFINHFGGASGPFNVKNNSDSKYKNEIVNSWFEKPCSVINELEIDSRNKINISRCFYIYNYFHQLKSLQKRICVRIKKYVILKLSSKHAAKLK